MGYKHTRESILQGAIAVSHADGLSQLSYGRVARHLGISDRTVVYYFPTKDALVTEMILTVGVRLLETLNDAIDGTRAADHLALLRRLWPAMTQPDIDDIVALFFEANGLATAGRVPYTTFVPDLVKAWINWAHQQIEGTETHRRTEAETAVVIIEGLLLVRQLAGAEPAERAARRLGITLDSSA